jgi:3-oxoacyl-[acyl-carrier protein] reductase
MEMTAMFKGKTVLVTGSGRGIGKAIALKFASLGANVVVNFVSNASAADSVVAEIMDLGSDAIAVQADIGSYEEAGKLIAAAVEKFGSLDILVNNSGITRDALILRMKEQDFDDVIRTNLKGAFNCIKFAAPIMLKQKSGRIVNISSVSGQLGSAGQANYAAAKAGLIALTKTTARELAPRGITVNAIAPGFIETDMTGVLSDDLRQKILAQIPLNSIGRPEDVAALAVFLASEDAHYMTGQVINVDGGLVMQ